MDNPVISSILFSLVGILFISISIPLILERAPPNHTYGFRTRKTLSNEKIWYAANRASGYDLFLAGVIITVSSLMMLLFGRGLEPEKVVFTLLAVLMLSLTGAVLNSYRKLRMM